MNTQPSPTNTPKTNPLGAAPVVDQKAPVAEDAKPKPQKLTLEQFEKEIVAFGAAYGAGQNSRPSMAVRAVEAAAKVTTITPDSAEVLWTKFQQAAAKKRGLEYKQEGSFKVQVSKFRQFLALGALPSIDPVDVIERTVYVIRELANQADSPLKGSAYDHMVNIARAQLKTPETALTNDQIKAELLPEEVEEKTPLDKLLDTYKKVTKLHDVFGKSPDVLIAIEDAIENLQNAITKAGGEVPADKKTKEEGAKVAALLVNSKRGNELLRGLHEKQAELASVLGAGI